jgi:hypothetical protein
MHLACYRELEGTEPWEAQSALEDLATHLGARDIELPGID